MASSSYAIYNNCNSLVVTLILKEICTWPSSTYDECNIANTVKVNA